MPDAISFGPFLIRSSLLAMILGGAAGYFVMKRQLKNTPFEADKMLDAIITGLLIAIMIWKLGPALLSPSVLLGNPALLLYLSGTSLHAGIGVFIALLYIYRKLRKIGVPFIVFLDVLPFGILPVLAAYHLLIPQ